MVPERLHPTTEAPGNVSSALNHLSAFPVSCVCHEKQLQAGKSEADRKTVPDSGLAGGMCWFWLSDGFLERNQSDSQSKHAHTHKHTHLHVQARALPQVSELRMCHLLGRKIPFLHGRTQAVFITWLSTVQRITTSLSDRRNYIKGEKEQVMLVLANCPPPHTHTTQRSECLPSSLVFLQMFCPRETLWGPT